jgi:CDP-diacylglycerol--glycerol-3-phosphate 3-phosphatidyltransferase
LSGICSLYIGGDYKLYIPGVKFHVFETISIFTVPIVILAVLTNITAFKRLIDAKKSLLELEEENNPTN